MRLFKRTAILACSSVLAVGVFAQAAPKPAAKPKQVVTGPVAVYWMDTATSSGMSGMMGAGKPSMSSIMGGMMGGGNNISHTLNLALGSSQAASGELAANHLPPADLNVGNTLPLYWQGTKAVAEKPMQDDTPHDYEPPKGKILIFWGCGDHAPKNQPVVIDLSKLTDPAARMQTMKQMMPLNAIALDNVHPPRPNDWKSFGEWPNKKGGKAPNGDSSLIGAHAVKGNYSPDIAFSLSDTQDFLPPIEMTGNDKTAVGNVALTWRAMPRARGFIATAIGGGQDTVVMWTSAEVQTAWMGMAPQYLTANDVDRLQAQKALMPGSATACTVPAEVMASSQALIYGLTAYGADANFSYPPRPEDAATPWNIQWETKVRYRTSTGGMLGQNMGQMGARSDDSAPATNEPDKKKKKGSMFGNILKQGAGLIP